MCGVAALFAYHDAAPAASRDELGRMLAALRTRGPDGEGDASSDEGRVLLGNRRLEVICPGPDGAQPMTSDDGRVLLVMNGEIYNHRELASELDRRGRTVRTQSDTEVVLRLVEELGERAFERLQGMFAVIAFDRERRRMWLARDSYGIKPLYYADDGWTFRTASQVEALTAGGAVSKAVDDAAVAGFLLTGSVPDPFTWRRDVAAVPAGCVLEVDELGAREPQPFRPVSALLRDALDGPRAADPDAGNAAVSDSVRRHRVSDVGLGLFLSGGVDSSLVMAHAASLGGDELTPVSVCFEDADPEDQEESTIAREVGERCGVDVAVRTVSSDELRREMPAVLDAMDQPTIDGINVWFASKATRELGLKATLAGIGGDELLGGYPSFKQVPRAARWLRPGACVPSIGRLARAIAAPRLPSHWSPKLASLLELGGTWPGAWLLRRGLFMPWEVERILGAERARAAWRRLRFPSLVSGLLQHGPRSDYGRVAALESCLYLRNQLLRDADWASMRWSVEVRVPFVDVELTRRLGPLLGRDGNDKRRLLDGAPLALPPRIGTRRKRGFHVPLSGWLDESTDGSAWRRFDGLSPKRAWARRYALVVADAKGLL